MEADILRLILFLVGAAIIFGIYAADRYKRNTQDSPERDWTHRHQGEGNNHIEPRWDRLYEPEGDEDYEDDELEEESQFDDSDEPYPLEEDEGYVSSEMDEAINSELEQLEEIIHEEHRHQPRHRADQAPDMPREQMSISFLSRDMRKHNVSEEDSNLPTKIIQLNIVPHDGMFYGDDILYVAQEVGLEPGEMDIFHHYGNDQDKLQVEYSMASMVEPGIFPMDDMDDFSTPGLTLFSKLPGPKDGLTIFTEMLHAAELLANQLEGELRDESHSALTKQTISHMREDIQEYHRQLQLARSKR